MITESEDLKGGYGDIRVNVEVPEGFDTSKKIPFVIIVHGLGVDKHEHSRDLYLDYTDEILDQGVGVIRFSHSMAEEEGVLRFDLESRVKDLHSVISYLRQGFDYIDYEHIGLVGYSWGCSVICSSLGFVDDFITKYIFLSPKIDLRDEMMSLEELEDISDRSMFEKWSYESQKQGWFEFDGEKVDRRFLDKNRKHSDMVMKNYKKIAKPVLLINGSKDRLDVVKEGMRLKEARDVEHVMITGADHELRPYCDYVGEKVASFMRT